MPAAPYPLDIKMERIGIEVEYAVRPAARTHLTGSSLVGGGALHYVKSGTSAQEGETDFVFLLQPAVGLEQRITAGLHLNLALCWRPAGGVAAPRHRCRLVSCGPVLPQAHRRGRCWPGVRRAPERARRRERRTRALRRPTSRESERTRGATSPARLIPQRRPPMPR